jgi:hypothetical protein
MVDNRIEEVTWVHPCNNGRTLFRSKSLPQSICLGTSLLLELAICYDIIYIGLRFSTLGTKADNGELKDRIWGV